MTVLRHTRQKLSLNISRRKELNFFPIPDLAPCDFYLFPKIKQECWLGEVLIVLKSYQEPFRQLLTASLKSKYYKSFDSWCNRLKKCIEIGGEYFEGM